MQNGAEITTLENACSDESREEASIFTRPVGEQLTVQSCVIKGPASTPSRSSSVSLEGLLAVYAGSPEGQRQVADAGIEGLQLKVSPWAVLPSPIALRPAEKRRSSRLNYGKRVTTGPSGPPRKRQKVEMVQVMKTGLPEDQAKVPAGSTPAGTDRPSIHHLSRPSMKGPYNGACLKPRPFISPDPIVLLGNHRGSEAGAGLATGLRIVTIQMDMDLIGIRLLIVYPGPPQNPHPHPPVNPSVFYHLPYQQRYVAFLKQVIFTIKTSPRLPLQQAKWDTLAGF